MSAAAWRRLHSRCGEPLFHADWERAVFLHFAVDAAALQRAVPFALDLREGEAFVSLVAFTMRRMRPCFGGRAGAWLCGLIGESRFLNVRAYVRHEDEAGIFFLAEWLSNHWSVPLGPALFGLPYRAGRLDYAHDPERGAVSGRVEDAGGGGALAYQGALAPDTAYEGSAAGSLDEFLLERYTAFTQRGRTQMFFRVWHPPWPQAALELAVNDVSLLTQNWPWFQEARFVGANYSPGAHGVCMGRPHRLGAAGRP